MAITNEATYTAAKAAPVKRPFLKVSFANTAATQTFSLWRATGQPAQANIPTAATVLTRATPGAVDFGLPAGANLRYVDAFKFVASLSNIYDFVDRIIEFGGLNGTVITAQAVNTPALPARVAPAAVEWYLEWYVDTGATATTATVAVTFTDATTANIAITVAATTRAGRLQQIIPTTGKIIASVQSVTLAASTLTAGNFGVTALARLGFGANIPISNAADRDAAMINQIPQDACVAAIVDCATTATGDLRGWIQAIEG
jgi:hypothetical protein